MPELVYSDPRRCRYPTPDRALGLDPAYCKVCHRPLVAVRYATTWAAVDGARIRSSLERTVYRHKRPWRPRAVRP